MPRANIFITKKDWSQFDARAMAAFKSDVFHYYRHERGFPYHPTDQEFRDKEYSKFWKYDFNKAIDGDAIRQTPHAGSLLWSYFPHAFSIRSYGRRTPIQIFNDDKLLAIAIEKAIKFGNRMSDNRMRGMLRMVNSAKAVSNFRPTAAAIIYNQYVQPGGQIYDPCAGFGGRMMGAARVGANYLGVDPSTKTYIGLKQVAEDYCPDINVRLIQGCAEDYEPLAESADFVLSSPPYYNLEQYSDEETQSYIKFPSRELWLEGFLSEMIKNVFRALKPGKFFALNIHGNKYFPDLEEKALALADAAGFKRTPERDLKLILSPVMGTRKFRDDKERFEPIYLLRKE